MNGPREKHLHPSILVVFYTVPLWAAWHVVGAPMGKIVAITIRADD
ncbi:MAG: hypothetical protein ACP5E5_09715 [Acidobacteriaceae bacterium]